VFRGARRLLPASSSGVTVAAAIAGFASVLLSAISFSLMWLFGASAAVPFDRVFTAMVGVHALIGVGEAVITAGVVAAVLAVRPDLVRGADGIDARRDRVRLPRTRFVVLGLLAALAVAVGVAQFAVDEPDGLERVAVDLGFDEAGQDHLLANSVFSDYATTGVASEPVSLALAGVAGTLLTLAVGTGLLLAVRERRGGESARADQTAT
jgi:cobalt/nickel transport system permease protein